MDNHFHPRFTTVLAAVLLMLVFCIGAFAQGTGELTGAVTDPTGAVVPNVQVKLTNTATGIVRTTVTSGAGIYRFSALPVVGTYTLAIDAKGFKKTTVQGIVASVGTTVTKDVRLEIGASNEVVNVEGGVQMVQTSDSQVSDLINNRVWQQMPLETRNQNEFINLVAGVTPAQFDSSTRGSAVNGTRGGSGNFLVEGMDNNDQGQGGRGQISDSQGGAITGISPEAIQEYRVITNSFAAEYGKAGGFVTDTVLKSGTNAFHGSIFEYNRNQALAANNFFSNRTIDPETGKTLKDFRIRNQFGGSFGGALVKDKTFFYSSVEIHRRRDKYPTTAVGITPDFLNFVKSGGLEQWAESSPDGLCMQYNGAACPGAFSQAATLGPVFQRLMAKGPFPLAQSAFAPTKGLTTWDGKSAWSAEGDYTYGLAYPVPEFGNTTVRDGYSLNENKWSLKLDHKLSANDQLSGSYIFDDGDQYWKYGGGDNTIGPPSYSPGRSQNLGVSWNHTFSPTVLNTFKVSYLRHRSDYPVTKGYDGIPSIYTYDSLSVGFGQSSSMPQFFTDNQFQYQDSISFVKGKHSFKTGVEYRRTRNGSSFEADKNGEFAPYGIEDLMTDGLFGDLGDRALGGNEGSFYVAVASVDPTTGKQPVYYRGFRANEFAAYFQDDFRVNNRLTLNYGVRWEYFGPPHNFKAGLDSNYYFGTAVTPINVATTNPFYPTNSPDAARVYTGSFQQRDHEIWNKDTNNFGPRFGFAYDALGNQKFVVRGGFGIMYDRIYNNLFENIRFNSPFFSYNNIGTYVNGVAAGALSTPGLYTDNFTPANTAMFNNPAYAPTPSPRHMDQNLVSPYYEQYHLGFQYEVLKGYVLETEYVGTMGHKLTGIKDINTYDGRTACSSSYASTDKTQWAKCVAAGLGTSGAGSFSTRRITTAIAGDNFRTNGFSSNYHSLQVTLKKSFSNGLQFNSNYTWAKALDYLSDAFNARTGLRPTDNWNPRLDYGSADFDIRQRFVTSFSYDLPFAKGNRWLGGWSVNSIISVQTGVPFSPYSSSSTHDSNRDGYSTDRYNYVGSGSLNSLGKIDKTIADTTDVGYFPTTAWAPVTCPANVNKGLWCDGGWGRNSMHGPGFFNTDMGFSKKFKVTERSSLELQGNLFNIFNHTNFALPHFNANSGNFGQISATANDPRVTQLALRFDF